MMKRVCLVQAMVVCAASLGLALSPAARERPNIVLILSDDYGYGSATCYGADPALIRTPHIDRLAREGRRFTDACTPSSVCSPTRYSVLTGRYCWRTSLKNEVLGTTSPLHIEPGRLTLASLLKKQGYTTAAVGKWHLGYGDAPRTDYPAELKPGPLEIGFDYHFGVPANHGDIAGVYIENHTVAGLRSRALTPGQTGVNFKNQPYLGLDAPHRVDVDVMPVITDKAVGWLEKQSSAQPFFLYFTPVAVHRPNTPSAQTRGTSKAGPYGDWIHELDLSVGRVLDALDRTGVAGNTLVLFTSDNGGVCKTDIASEETDAIKAGLTINGPFRGGKHDVWEGGFRVPYLLRWPGRVPANSVCGETLSLVDTLATVAALIGEPLPPVQTAAEDSYNMLPAWLGQRYAGPIRSHLIVHSADGNFAIRRGDWKWIEGDYHPATRTGALRQRADQFSRQLYNIREDIGESRDLHAAHPELSGELAALLERYRAGGYSRELPPPPPPCAPTPPPGDLKGRSVFKAAFAGLPEPPWTEVRGKWNAAGGILRGSQQGGDNPGAAIRMPLNLGDGDIRYALQCPPFAGHILRLQSDRRETVFQITMTPRHFTIVRLTLAEGRESVSETLAEAKINLDAADWSAIRCSFRGAEVAVQAGDTTVRAADPALAVPRRVLALMVKGSGVAFRDLEIFGE